MISQAGRLSPFQGEVQPSKVQDLPLPSFGCRHHQPRSDG